MKNNFTSIVEHSWDKNQTSSECIGNILLEITQALSIDCSVSSEELT